MIEMERLHRIWVSPLYRDYLSKIEEREKDRLFCKHDFAHGLEVARLSWIFSLEEGVVYAKDLVYAAAFLHDIGRWMEYDDHTRCHAHASAELAESLLTEAGYSAYEKKLIKDAVREHRQGEEKLYSSPLSVFLRKADKYSRLCFQCSFCNLCYKSEKMPHSQRLIY